MRPLTLYFNEFSTPPTEFTNELSEEWGLIGKSLYRVARNISNRQRSTQILFHDQIWHAVFGDKNLSTWMKKWLERDEYRWLLSKLAKATPHDNLAVDVMHNGVTAKGLTWAYLANSWAISFRNPNGMWEQESITSQMQVLDENGNLSEEECHIRHISSQEHLIHWHDEIDEWGRVVADTHVIAEFGEFNIVMYRIDHEPPHIHLINNKRDTLAKYRIDSFSRLQGPPMWDNQIRPWIDQHSELLMLSWVRCSRGLNPFRINE